MSPILSRIIVPVFDLLLVGSLFLLVILGFAIARILGMDEAREMPPESLDDDAYTMPGA